MKQRNGFVSNSSSSSFVLIGYNLGHMSYEERLKLIHPSNHEEVYKKIEAEAKEKDYAIEDVMADYIYDNQDAESGLSTCCCGYSGNIYFGRFVAKEKDSPMSNVDLSGEDLQKLIKKVHELSGQEAPPSLIVATIGC